MSRSTQTNEVGRLATLLPAFAHAVPEGPVALIEAGASAGLNLYPDRWGYEWSTTNADVTLGDEPRLACEVTGPAPLPEAVLEVAWRGGVDLNPLSVSSDEEMHWLELLVWPEQDDRRERLRHAVEVARTDPPHVVRGDLLDELPGLVAEASAYGTALVFHSAVAAYLDKNDRTRMLELMTGLVAEGRCHWVSNEAPTVFPEIAAEDPPEWRFQLSVDGRAVGFTQGHGHELTWLG